MVTKQEAIGIFLSIGVMALALAFFRFQGTEWVGLPAFGGNNEASVIMADNQEGTDATAVEAALTEAVSSHTATLERLVIDDVVLGSGATAQEGNTVVVHYVGSTRDGVQFDSSYKRGEAFTFTIGQGRVIEGWEVGLVGMKEGGKRVLVIPPAMAYGNAQVGPIPPNSPLVFLVELLEVK